MKRILLCTTLLLLTGLHGQAVFADAYTASGVISSPANGAVYTIFYGDSIQIPITITNQFVEVNHAAPSTPISVSWKMISAYGTSTQGTLLAGDFSGGQRVVMTDKNGVFHRNVFDAATGNLSASVKSYGGSYTVDTESVITPLSGAGFTSIAETKFTVDVVH